MRGLTRDGGPVRRLFRWRPAAGRICLMCRVLAYLGPPLNVEACPVRHGQLTGAPGVQPANDGFIFEPRRLWDGGVGPEFPDARGAVRLPGHDAPGIRSESGESGAEDRPELLAGPREGRVERPRRRRLAAERAPFLYSGAHVALAHNGYLRDFGRMRHGLLEFRRRAGAAVRERPTPGWLRPHCFLRLDDPYGVPGPDELAAAVAQTLSIVRRVQERHDIRVSSPVNLFVSTGQCVIVTRFSFDYGWYPPKAGSP